MTKNNEIEILRETAKRLGPDSYCGEWLASILPQIEAEIRSDYIPIESPAETESRAKEIVATARLEAAEIVKRANEEKTKLENDMRKLKDAAAAALYRTRQEISDLAYKIS